MIFTKKKLEAIHKTLDGMMSFEQFFDLYKEAKRVKKGVIVEVGSYRGMSTVALSLGARKGVKVFAVDPHEEFIGVLGGVFGPEDRAKFYQTMISTGCYKNVRLVNLTSELVAPNWDMPIGLLFIDGDHSYKGVKRDYDYWSPHVSKDARIAFDDTDSKKLGPARLVEELCNTGKLKRIRTVKKGTVCEKLV